MTATIDKPAPYRFLEQWARPSHYMGATWEGYFSSGVGQSRDSDALERANFEAMRRALKGCKGWQVVRESHWAVGWVEWIAISPRASKALKIANEIMEAFADYPCIDEMLYSEIEDDDCRQTWENCYSDRKRLKYLREHSYTAESWRDVRAAVKGDWGAAARMLHSPSDLIR